MRRITIAFIISLIGLALSWVFLRPQQWVADSVNSKQSIAQVMTLRNDVSRQQEGRLLWSPIRQGDEIYLGDKIKTSGLSSTIIQFKDSTSKLEIEENSMIVVSQGGEKLSLNMLEGRVFIQGDAKASDALSLVSGGKQINYSGDTAISVGQDGASRVESFDQGSNTLFKNLSPSYSQNILSKNQEVLVTWAPQPSDQKVEIYIGESPLTMKKVSNGEALLSQGKIKTTFRPGLNYWQLLTIDQGNEVRSALMKLSLQAPIAPSPISPSDKELIKAETKPFDFKWNRGNAGDASLIEVARDQAFKNIILADEVKDQTFFTPPSALSQGEYFWRLRSQLPTGEWIESQVNSFTIHQGESLLSPAPLLPADNSIFYLGNNENEIKFEWKRQEGVKSFNLKISGENFLRETQVNVPQASMNINRLGKYVWEVSSEGQNGKSSILPVKRSFEVRALSRIEWISNQKVYNYLENLPIVILRWKKNNLGPSSLKISSSPDLKDAESINVQGNDFPYRIPKDGRYFARVLGLDAQGEVSAQSEILEFEVKEAPLPPAPLAKNGVTKLLTSSAGDMSLIIENSKPGWLLIAQLANEKGGVIDERRFSDSTIGFRGLLPGKYIVRSKFQDEFNRMGEISLLEIEVPEKSKIAAPKLKGIKVR